MTLDNCVTLYTPGKFCNKIGKSLKYKVILLVESKYLSFWVQIWYYKLSHVWFFVTPWTIAHQAPLSVEFFRQEYWSGLPFPSPRHLPNLGIKPVSRASLEWQVNSLPLSHLHRESTREIMFGLDWVSVDNL